MTETAARKKKKEHFRILLLGFDDAYYFSSLATFRDLYDSDRFERVADVDSIDTRGPAIYSVIVNARSVGLSVEEFMKPLHARLPNDHIVVYAYGSLALGLIRRYYQSGADVVFANVETDEDFRSLRDAVKRRYGYKTESIRNALDTVDNEKDLQYRALSSKLRLYAWYTVQGFSVKEIADAMHVTAATVTMMRKRALDILGLRHTSQLIHDGILYAHGIK